MIHNCSDYVESSCTVLFCFVHTFQLSEVLVCLVIKYVFLLLVTVYCVLGQTKTVLSFSMYFFSQLLYTGGSPSPFACEFGAQDLWVGCKGGRESVRSDVVLLVLVLFIFFIFGHANGLFFDGGSVGLRGGITNVVTALIHVVRPLIAISVFVHGIE